MTADVTYDYGQPVWILPEEWRGHIFSFSEDRKLFLVTYDGQGGRARWCRKEDLESRESNR